MQIAAEQLTGDAAAATLSKLTEQAGTKAGRAEIDAALAARTQITDLLRSDVPKVRKNAARLLGALQHGEDAATLVAALNGEETLFVVPSILLALGNIGGDEARSAIQAYAPPEPSDVSEEKHCREIADALKKARSKLSADEPLPVYSADEPRDVLLVPPEGFSETLRAELSGMGETPRVTAQGVLVHTDRLQKLFHARCFYEMLLPVKQHVPASPDAIARAVLDAGGLPKLPWRAELRGYEGDRRACIQTLTDLLKGDNDPSHYAVELRIECAGGFCDLFLKPTSIPDGRFSYRKKAISASIAPATAACLARLAADVWAKRNPDADAPHALDPFCGSGTLLIELNHYLPARTLTGADISTIALDAAKCNARAAHVPLQLIRKDAARFVAKEPYDIILTNMPFGNRVGTHAENEPLYRDFCRRLPELLADSGVAVLYTAEYRLLTASLKRVPQLQLVTSLRTEAGGLTPWVFVLQKTGEKQKRPVRSGV